MKKNKSNLLQKKNISSKRYSIDKNNGVKYIEDKLNNNKNTNL